MMSQPVEAFDGADRRPGCVVGLQVAFDDEVRRTEVDRIHGEASGELVDQRLEREHPLRA